MRVKLTDDLIANELHCPPGKKRIEYVDISDAIGLYLEVRLTRPAEGVFYYRYKDPGGTTRHARIGRTTDVTLEDARTQAKAMRAKVTLGIDPRGDQQPRTNGNERPPTLSAYFDETYYPYISVRNRGAKKTRQIFDLRIRPRFGDRRLDEITREQIQVFHTSLLKDEGLAPATANHHLRLLKTMYRRAVDWEITSHNPTTRLQLFREDNEVENLLDEESLARLLHVLKTSPARNACNVALLLLATGTRLSEALHAKWVDIDREHRHWTIRAQNSKSKRVRSVPLNDAALDVLDQLTTEGKHEYLFVNPYGERLKHIHACWDRIRKKAELPHLRLHDLRHQYASFLVNSGRTLYEVSTILGHADPSVTTRYAHLSTRAMADAAGAASDAISAALRRGV
jgi:integrase